MQFYMLEAEIIIIIDFYLQLYIFAPLSAFVFLIYYVIKILAFLEKGVLKRSIIIIVTIEFVGLQPYVVLLSIVNDVSVN